MRERKKERGKGMSSRRGRLVITYELLEVRERAVCLVGWH